MAKFKGVIKKRGFTIIELAVGIAIAIIILLVWIVANGIQNATTAKAEAQMSRLETAIKMYEIDVGKYPGKNNKTLIAALTVNTKESGWNGPYLQIKKNGLNRNGEYLDAWGRVYVYRNPGINNTSSYDIYSKGRNGVGDGNDKDDIKNWEEKNSGNAVENSAE